MTSDLQKEYARLADAARHKLKDVAESGSYRRVFSFWSFPSFAPSFCWTIYTPHSVANTARPFADYTVWRSDLDLEKMRSPVERLKYPKDLHPTIDGESVPLTKEEVETMESTISGIAIPLCLREPTVVGCDGTRYEFQYSRFMFSASLQWWESYPQEWRPLTVALIRSVEELESQRTKGPNKALEPRL
jgi:hypothetical protein